MRALKLITAVALVMVVTGTTWAVTVPTLPSNFIYDKSRNEDFGSTYVVAGLNPGDQFIFDPTGLPGDGSSHSVTGTLNGTAGVTRSVQKYGALGAIGNEDSWGIALMYQLAPGHLNNPGSNGSIVGFVGPNTYDNSAGTQGTWLTAMFHGGVDTHVIQVAGNDVNGIPTGQQSQTVSTKGLQFELYAVDRTAIEAVYGTLASNSIDATNLVNYVAANRTAANEYVGWTGNTIAGSVLLVDGNSDYHQSTVVIDSLGAVVSNSLDATNAYFDVLASGAGLWDTVLGQSDQLLTPTGTTTNLWFQWTLANGQRGWDIHSDDIGGGFSVPEPVTILGLTLGVGGLGGYLRRRFQAV